MLKKILFLFLLINSAGICSQNNSYLKSLIKKARKEKVYEKRMWHILLHYDRAVFSNYKSEADGEDFFFSRDGKRNPESEMEMTIRAFFKKDTRETMTSQHPQCQFPARFEWLVKELDINIDKLPAPECKRFKKWRSNIKASSVTLVYSSAYLNNPASMYGHTFLRIDRKGLEKFSLLSYVVNFSANPTTSNPLFYSFKGLFGGFKGSYSTLPYYLKVKEYGSMENRDLWEYKLNIKKDRVDFMLKHIWELGSTYFDYYYLDENCSYHILSLIEVAEPDFRFRDYVSDYFVIPTETIKYLYTRNLVSKVVYRPSLLNELKHIKLRLNSKEIDLVEEIVDSNGKKINLIDNIKDEYRKALILDAVVTLDEYLNSSDSDSKKSKKLRKAVLLKRSKVRVKLKKENFKMPFNPKDAHAGGFFQVGYGLWNSSRTAKFMVRTSLNDLLSDHAGYIPASEIQLSSFSFKVKMDTVSYYPYIKSRLFPDSINLVKITSISPLEAWIRKISWRLWFGAKTPEELGEYNWKYLYYGLTGGPGITFKTHILNNEYYYMFLDSEAVAGKYLDENYRIGFGGSAGIYFEITDNINFQTEFSYLYHVLGDRRTGSKNYRITYGATYTLEHEIEFRVQGKKLSNNINEIFFSAGAFF